MGGCRSTEGIAEWRNELNQQPKEELGPGRAPEGWVMKHDLVNSSYRCRCDFNAQQHSAPNCMTEAARPGGHSSTATFLLISSRGRFNYHEVTAAAACVDAPPSFIPLSQAGLALLGGLLRSKAKAGLILVLACCGCVSTCRCAVCAHSLRAAEPGRGQGGPLSSSAAQEASKSGLKNALCNVTNETVFSLVLHGC